MVFGLDDGNNGIDGFFQAVLSIDHHIIEFGEVFQLLPGGFQAQGQAFRRLGFPVAQALEQIISDPTSFTAPSAQALTVNGVNVATTAAVCYHSTIAEGYEINVGADGKVVGPEDNVWEVRGSGTDALTGAQATVTQGLRIRMLPNNCP